MRHYCSQSVQPQKGTLPKVIAPFTSRLKKSSIIVAAREGSGWLPDTPRDASISDFACRNAWVNAKGLKQISCKNLEVHLTPCRILCGQSFNSRVILELQTDAFPLALPPCKRGQRRVTEIENVIAMVFAHCRHSPLVRVRPRTRCLRACGHVKVERKWPKSTARSEGRATGRGSDGVGGPKSWWTTYIG